MTSQNLSLREAKISLSRFENTLPSLYRQLHQHVQIIRIAKQKSNIRALNKEQVAASKTFKTLKRYLQDLDELECRVSLDDLPKFKLIADPLKMAAYEQIVEFVELDAQLDSSQLDESSPTAVLPVISPPSPPGPSREMEEEEEHPELASLQQLQRTEDEVQELEAVGESWRNLQQDLQDVAEMMTTMSKLVKEQQEKVDTIEGNVVEADMKTKEGLLEIIKARRAKWAGMPIAGALVGGLIAGPLGMLAGFKAAGVATGLIGTYVGYKGTSYLKRSVNDDIPQLEAPKMGAFSDEEGEEGEFQQFEEGELRDSESFKPFK
eukprot:sb/3466837/